MKKQRPNLRTLEPRVRTLDLRRSTPLRPAHDYQLLAFETVHPPRADSPRRNLKPGDLARVCVLVDLDHTITPTVEIVEATPTGYVAVVSSAMGTDAWLPYGTRIAFSFDCVVDPLT